MTLARESKASRASTLDLTMFFLPNGSEHLFELQVAIA